MTIKKQLTLSFTSRFKKTPVYTKNGKTFFGLWKPPSIKIDGDEKVVTISAAKKGQLDKTANEEYGTRELWWAIALVNNIVHPPDEVVAGLELVIPKLENIRQALQDND